MILDAISESNNKMSAELEIVRSDLKCMKDDLQLLKSEIGSVSMKVKDLDKRQKTVEESIHRFDKRFEELEYTVIAW